MTTATAATNLVTLQAPWPLPHSWRWEQIGNVSEVVGGGTPSTGDTNNFGGEIPWITPADLSGYTGKHISRGARNITTAGLNGSGARLLPAGSVLFSSRAPIGYVVIARNPVSTNQGFKSFVLGPELLSDYVYHWLFVAREFAVKLASGTTFLEISGKKAAQLPVPVAPIETQRKIVAYLDEQLSRLDAIVAALLRAQANLKRYRASVLKAACEGRLVATEAELARAEGRTFETGAQLLQRVVADRRHTWAGRGKYNEPAAVESHLLPEAPLCWTWACLEGLVANGPQNGLYVPKASYGSGVPIIRISDYQNDWHLPFSELQRVNIEAKTADIYRVRDGDILVNRVNSLTHLGKTLLVRSHGEMPVFESNMMRIRLSSAVVPEYVALYLQSSLGRARLNRGAKWAVNQASINQQDVCGCPIPLPPLPEQHRIVAEADRRLSLIRGAEAQVSANLARAKRLRQSILQAAFAPA